MKIFNVHIFAAYCEIHIPRTCSCLCNTKLTMRSPIWYLTLSFHTIIESSWWFCWSARLTSCTRLRSYASFPFSILCMWKFLIFSHYFIGLFFLEAEQMYCKVLLLWIHHGHACRTFMSAIIVATSEMMSSTWRLEDMFYNFQCWTCSYHDFLLKSFSVVNFRATQWTGIWLVWRSDEEDFAEGSRKMFLSVLEVALPQQPLV